MRWITTFHNALEWANNLRIELLKLKNLEYLGILAIIVTLIVGLVFYLIDPNIKSPLDGIWSAWVTMTHVGFGDVVPVSFFGRLLAAGLILFGLVLFSLFTALISVEFIGKDMNTLGGSVIRIEQETSSIHSGEERILEELHRLHERMEALENQLLSGTVKE